MVTKGCGPNFEYFTVSQTMTDNATPKFYCYKVAAFSWLSWAISFDYSPCPIVKIQKENPLIDPGRSDSATIGDGCPLSACQYQDFSCWPITYLWLITGQSSLQLTMLNGELDTIKVRFIRLVYFMCIHLTDEMHPIPCGHSLLLPVSFSVYRLLLLLLG